jgi:hypothetical protein
MDIGLRTWGIIAGWQGGGTVRRMKEPTGTTLIMITTGKGGSCMKAIGIMRIMGARLVTTRIITNTNDGKGVVVSVRRRRIARSSIKLDNSMV